MINNDFYFVYSSWGGELYMKVKFPVNAEKINEILSYDDWRGSHPEIPFAIQSSNVKDTKRFLRTSKAKHSISLSRSFRSKGTITEKQCIDWFTRGEKQERYIILSTSRFFPDYSERRLILDELKKTKDPIKLVERIKTKGLDFSELIMTGPKFKIPEKAAIKFKIDGDINMEDLIKRCDRNDSKVKLISKFIVDGHYQFRFLDYD